MARPDNVTPLRPRRRQRRGLDLRAPRSQVLLVHALTGVTFATFYFATGAFEYIAMALGVAAIAIAAGRRREGMPWACTHHEFALRTLLFGGVAWVLVRLASLIPVVGAYQYYAIWAICGWVALRVVWGFSRGVLRLPIHRPLTPFI